MSIIQKKKQTNHKGGRPAREKLLEVASDLFYSKGIHAVGVEEIVEKAGVAKISLYRSYASKNELIVAYLEKRNNEFWREIDGSVFNRYADPLKRLRALMKYLAKRTRQNGYRGCSFLNYCGEFSDSSHPGYQIVQANRREWRRRLQKITRQVGLSSPNRVADSLLLLVEGAYGLSQSLRSSNGPARALEWAAMTLISKAESSSALAGKTR